MDTLPCTGLPLENNHETARSRVEHSVVNVKGIYGRAVQLFALFPLHRWPRRTAPQRYIYLHKVAINRNAAKCKVSLTVAQFQCSIATSTITKLSSTKIAAPNRNATSPVPSMAGFLESVRMNSTA